jgi:hypothetical protein
MPDGIVAKYTLGAARMAGSVRAFMMGSFSNTMHHVVV